MTVGVVESPAGLQETGDDLRPSPHVGEPAGGAPGHIDEIERGRLRDRRRRVVEIGADEACSAGQSELDGERVGRVDGGRRKVETDDGGAALREAERVGAEMALQVKHPQAAHVAELGLLYGIQPAASGAQRRQIVAWRLEMNPDATSGTPRAPTLNVIPQASTYVSASPKLGLLYHFDDTYSGYFQYATGFRAPPYDNANFGFTNAASFYQILPNANLKPETANSFEVGLRGKYENGSSWQLTGFYNLYNNFLETTVVGMVGPITQFQYVNLTNVTIWGIEARGEYRFAPEWAVAGWTAFAQGTDTRTGLPVDSVSPWTTQARIRYGFDKGLVAQLIGTVAAAHSAVSSPTGLPGSGLLQPRRHRRLRHQRPLQVQCRRVQHHQRQVLELAGHGRRPGQQPADRSLRSARPLLWRQPDGEMVVPAALSAERLPAPPARGPRVPVALSLALHGLAIVPLLLAGMS
ncbi:TonB-dependent receptor, partial [Ostertagia ostertagi]